MNAPDNRIRVAFLARSLEATGGAEQQLAHIALGLDPALFESRVYCFYETGELCRHIRAGGIRIDTLRKESRWDLIDPALLLRRKLREFRPQILHSFLGPPNVLAAVLKPALPHTKVIWGVRASDMKLENYDWTRRATFRAEVMLSRIPDAIVANSEAGRKHVTTAGFPDHRVSVLPNGIDIRRFVPVENARERVRASLNIPFDAPVVGMIARIDPQKDHLTFLRAVRRAVTRIPELVFLCVGGGPDSLMEALHQFAHQLGVAQNIRWTGERTDIPDLISACDLMTLTSAYGEGFPNAIGEAMACERTCVVTDVGDCASIVGKTGFVAARGDDGALSNLWLDFFQLAPSAQRKIGQRARRRIEENYSLESMVRRSERLYSSIVQLSAPPLLDQSGYSL